MTESRPLVSVLINCYNAERYLREAIDSVMAQTYPRWELILWDNQSTDSTATIVKSYGDSRINYYRAPQHTSLGAARGLAIVRTRGDFVAILDSDDVWKPEKLERQVAAAQQQPDAALIYSDYDIISSDGTPRGAARRRAPARSGEVFDALLCQDFTVCWPTAVFRTNALREVGPFAPLRYVEDLELMLRVAARWPFAYVPERLASYRVHANQLSVHYTAMRDEVLGICDDWERTWAGVGTLTAERRRVLRRARARAWSIAAKNAMSAGESPTPLYARSLRHRVSAEALFGMAVSLFGARVAAALTARARSALGYGNV